MEQPIMKKITIKYKSYTKVLPLTCTPSTHSPINKSTDGVSDGVSTRCTSLTLREECLLALLCIWWAKEGNTSKPIKFDTLKLKKFGFFAKKNNGRIFNDLKQKLLIPVKSAENTPGRKNSSCTCYFKEDFEDIWADLWNKPSKRQKKSKDQKCLEQR